MIRLTLHRPALLVLLILLLAGASAGTARPGAAQSSLPDFRDVISQETLAAHLDTLAGDIGARPAGSDAEARAADYVADQFAQWGYEVDVQEFEHGSGSSRNVIASRAGEGPGLIIGAHLDSVSDGTGADDNASGVAVILAAAEAMADIETRRPVTFVAFGAEETGLEGSRAYLRSLGHEGLADIWLMINVDTVGAGDYFYVYAGAVPDDTADDTSMIPGPTWVRDRAIEVGTALGFEVLTTPPKSWDGFIGGWSDHQPFAEQGIPIAYFERWNWKAGDDLYWGRETVAGDILHTPADQVYRVDLAKMEPVAETLAALVAALGNEDSP